MKFNTGKSYINRFSHLGGDADLGKQIITGMLKTYYGLADDKIADILKDGRTADEVAADIADLDKVRVKNLSEKNKKTDFQDGYKKAKAEERTAVETELKAHYGIDSDLQGTALTDHILATKVAESGASGEDAIRKSPTYVAAETKWKKEIADTKKTYEDKITAINTAQQKEKAVAVVATSALDRVNANNPVIPATAAVADTQRSNFVSALGSYEYTFAEDGKTVATISKDGKVLEDGHGNNLTYDAHVDNIASKHFEFSANNGGANGGNDNKGGAAGAGAGGGAAYPANIKKPQSREELGKILNSDIKVSDKRIVKDEYEKRMKPK